MENAIYSIEVGILGLLILPMYFAYRSARTAYLKASIDLIRAEIWVCRSKYKGRQGVEALNFIEGLASFLSQYMSNFNLLNAFLICRVAHKLPSPKKAIRAMVVDMIQDEDLKKQFERLESDLGLALIKHISPFGLPILAYPFLSFACRGRTSQEVAENIIMDVRNFRREEFDSSYRRCAA